MQGKRRFYDIEDNKNSLTKKIPQGKTERSKRFTTVQIESKSEYLSISKLKTKQFQRQPKKIKESDENYKRMIKNIWESKILISFWWNCK